MQNFNGHIMLEVSQTVKHGTSLDVNTFYDESFPEFHLALTRLLHGIREYFFYGESFPNISVSINLFVIMYMERPIRKHQPSN